MTSDLRNKETVEIEFYKFSADESPASTSTFNILNKMAEGLIMLDCINRFQDIFVKSKSVLELAGGQGWASCLVKRLFPEKRVVLSDISEFAVASVSKWEYLFQVKLDGARASRIHTRYLSRTNPSTSFFVTLPPTISQCIAEPLKKSRES